MKAPCVVRGVLVAISVGAIAAFVAGCAAPKSAPASPAAEGASGQGARQAGYPAAADEAAPASAYAAPPPPLKYEEAKPTTPAAAPTPAPAPAAPGAAATGGAARSLAIQSASRDVASAERELDAVGDCAGACRALGSMDRAAGRLCELSQGDGDGRRCEDARRRVYSARDRVKATCGGCPNGPSVERSAPIPSVR